MQIDGREEQFAIDRGATIMMDGMMNCGGWGMGTIGLLAVIFLVLGIAAFARYLFWNKG